MYKRKQQERQQERQQEDKNKKKRKTIINKKYKYMYVHLHGKEEDYRMRKIRTKSEISNAVTTIARSKTKNPLVRKALPHIRPLPAPCFTCLT